MSTSSDALLASLAGASPSEVQRVGEAAQRLGDVEASINTSMARAHEQLQAQEQLKAQIAQKTAERTEPERQRIVLMPTASETAGGKAQRTQSSSSLRQRVVPAVRSSRRQRVASAGTAA